MDRRSVFGIRAKLTMAIGFLFLALGVPTELVRYYGIPYTNFIGSRAMVKREALKNFSAVADLQKDRLLGWLAERKQDVFVLSASVKLQELLHQTSTAHEELTEWLTQRMKDYGMYDEVDIVDAKSGVVMASTDRHMIGTDVLGEGVSRGKDHAGDYVGNFYINVSQNRIMESGHSDLIIGHTVGTDSVQGWGVYGKAMVVVHANIEDTVMPFLRVEKGLGQSGEIVVVDQDRKILMPLKYPLKDGQIAAVLGYEITVEPATRAARGEEGIIEDLDYRGVPVLAAYRSIRFSSQRWWGMVVKCDRKEVYANLEKSRYFTVITGFIGILLGIVSIFLLAGNVTRPIRRMAEVAGRVEANDLSARVDVRTKDEIGVLAAAFNKMIARIQGWKEELERQVDSRTAELSALNQQLRASEQQLQAANQQLRAGHQQMVAYNEQMAANEKMLRVEIEHRKESERETQKHLRELQVFYKASIGREERIIELKNKIRALERELKPR